MLSRGVYVSICASAGIVFSPHLPCIPVVTADADWNRLEYITKKVVEL